MKAIGLLGIVFSLFFITSEALAQTPERIGSFRDWSSYAYTGPVGKVCYAATQPTDTQPTNVNRDPIFFMISTSPGEGFREQPSVRIGYPLQVDSKVIIDIDGREFTLFTSADNAWVENLVEEAALVTAMRAGRGMVIRGTSQRGTNTTDTYSLLGVTAALDSVNTECPAGPANPA